MMEFDQNILALIVEVKGFSPMAPAEEKAKRLKKCFKSSNIASHGKMLFFLILHTELEISKTLKNVEAFSFLADTCQMISLNDLCVIITQLDLINALCDIVSTCPAVISFEILNHLHEIVFQSENKYEQCRKLAVAVHDKYYKMICEFHREPDVDRVFDVFLLFLPSSYKSNGNQPLETVLCEINCQLEIWREVLASRTIKDMIVFRFPLNNSADCDQVCADFKNPTTKTLERFSIFLSDLKEILEDSRITDDLEMKKIVFENAGSLYETIKGRNLMNPENENWLESIKEDEISDCDLVAVIDKISDHESGKKWFKKLINHPNWFECDEAISCVSNHSKLIDSDDSKTLIDSLRTANFDEKLMKIYLNCFERIPIEDQIICFERHFEENRNFNFEMSDEDMTEKFNKLSESDPKTRTWLITSCVKSPVKTVTELCRLAVSNKAMFHPCVEYLGMLRRACLSRGEENLNLIEELVKSFVDKGSLPPSEKLLLISLISKLQEMKFLDFNFVNFCILKSIENGLIAENFEKVIFSLELLKSSVKSKIFPSSKRVVLAAFAVRVLSHTSWDCSKFSMELVQARELVIDVIDELMKSAESFNEVEVGWLRREILKSSELNQLCFFDFLCSDDSKFVYSKDVHLLFYALIHAKTKAQSMIVSLAAKLQHKTFLELRAIFILALVKLLPVLTAKEWTILFARLKSVLTAWSNLQVYDRDEEAGLVVVDIVTASLYCLSQDSNQHGDMSSCFEFCIRNYGRIIQKNFLAGENIATDVRIDLGKKILFLLNDIEDFSFRNSNSLILSSVLLRITDSPGGDERSLREMEEWFKRDFIQR